MLGLSLAMKIKSTVTLMPIHPALPFHIPSLYGMSYLPHFHVQQITEQGNFVNKVMMLCFSFEQRVILQILLCPYNLQI